MALPDTYFAERGELEEARRSLTGHERLLPDHEIITSKTDLRGIITYANDVFVNISGYTENELLGKPHSIIRHPAMPRCVFKLLWDTIQSGEEIFAYVVNRCKNGDHYWVFAHVTPSYDNNRKLIGFHSSRRAPRRDALAAISPVYDQLLAKENSIGGRAGMDAATTMLLDVLKSKNISYDQFVLSL